MQEPIEIKVMGQKFLLKGDYKKEYISQIERHIDGKIKEIQKNISSITTANLMVLVALNLVDDYFKKEEEVKKFISTIEEKSEMLLNLIDATI